MPYEPIPLESKAMLGHLAYEFLSSIRVGRPAPIVRDRNERSQNPQPGDWIVENSTLPSLLHKWPESDSRWDGQFIKYLRHEKRWCEFPDDDPADWVESWTAEEPPDREGWEKMSQTFIVCENPDGTEFAWENAEVTAVPLSGGIDPWGLRSWLHH